MKNLKDEIKEQNLKVEENAANNNKEDAEMKAEENKKETKKAPLWKRATLAGVCTLAVIASLKGCSRQFSAYSPAKQPSVLSETDSNSVDDTDVSTQTEYVDRIVEMPTTDSNSDSDSDAVKTVTEYVNVPGETQYVPVPGETQYVPGETKYIEVPGETQYVEVPVEVPVEVEVPVVKEVAHVYSVTNTVNNNDGTYDVTFTCDECGDTYTLTIGDETPVHEHKFELVNHVDATCTTNGSDSYACACGASYTEEIPAKGHQFGEWTVTTPATTTSNAIESRTCEVCGKIETREVENSMLHEHKYNETARVNATCTEDGYVEYTCECGDTYRDVLKATGHNYVEVPGTSVAPTEKSEGKEADQKCTNCGDVITGATIDKLPEQHQHSYKEVSRVEATCTKDGYVEYACECGDSYKETLAATGHNYVTDVKDATCEEAGAKTETCTKCGDTHTEEIPAKGHQFGEWVYNNDATYDADGTETRTCSVCGKTETRVAEGTKLQPEVNWKDTTRVEFNEYGWGFYTNLEGEDICTTRGAYKQYLEENYPNLTVYEDETAVWAE